VNGSSDIGRLTRRDLFRYGAGVLTSLSFAELLAGDSTMPELGLVTRREAMYYEKLDKQAVRCRLCPKNCWVGNHGRGYCEVRENVDGRYYTLVYGNPCALHIDPIEKKPLFHFLPSSTSLSLATAGCNMECKYCQNWHISQALPEDTHNYNLPPELVVDLAEAEKSRSISYTYTEPMVFYEYVLETSKLARKRGVKNVLVTNGFINEDPLQELCNHVDAANVDLKGFTEEFYSTVCDGSLKNVLSSLKTYRQRGVHLEITNLIIPTKNDNMELIGAMCAWIRDELGENTPLHFSRFYPMYKLRNLHLTPVETLVQARNLAIEKGLRYVYIGNVPGNPGEDTYCPNCENLLLDRTGFAISENNIDQGRCRFCKYEVPGVWE